MNSRILMTASAVLLGLAGIVLTFAPELALGQLGLPASAMALLLGQVVGGLYFGLAMLNWMLKDSVIGGIYNRPALVANLSHFVIAGLAILRQALGGGTQPALLWAAAAVYTLLGVGFGLLLLRHPVQKTAAQ
ncbi:MAG: hypothetical protein KIS88_02805 [Anaerolineales bacterium]|nr:hypothetical protein [Anaerolineales bacterium]